MIRVVIADDHPLFREGLRKALSMDPELRLVGEAVNGDECLAICGREHPDVLILDVTMPQCDGFGVLERLPRTAPTTRAVVLTVHLERSFEERALAAGARGFLQKGSSASMILQAVRAVAAGQIWATRVGTAQVLAGSPVVEVMSSLTSREREVFSFLGRGLMNREIAQETGLSEKTIASHVASLISKLGVRGRVAAALLARRYIDGLAPMESTGEPRR
jgi:DNA-binding NarL/FixJ family response regulator